MEALNRRDLLKMGMLGSAALLLPVERVARTQLAVENRIPQSRLPQPFSVPFAVSPVLSPVHRDATTDYYDLSMRVGTQEILPGLRTDVWGYNGIAPGPTIEVERGRQAIVRQANELPGSHPVLRYEPSTSVHLHGSASLPQYDGYASDVTKPGEFKDYRYPNLQEARTLWYHDHGVHRTAPNVYMGLAAQYHIHDALERSLPIPHGRYDVPLTIVDAIFGSDGSLVFDDNSESGLYGDVILVNGRPWPAMQVERRKYRFRILNASISRSYRLALDSGEPLTVIATDGGLMPSPQPVAELRHASAERYEVIIDFAKYRVGQRVVLRNLSNPNNIDFATTGNVMAFDVVSDATDTADNSIPDVLNPDNPVMKLDESMAVTTRRFRFDRGGGQWTINGSTWADVINSDFQFVLAKPRLNDVEIWELENRSGGWFHPVHMHLIDFRILDRNGRPPLPHELGPKDVAYVGENETVRVIARFGPQRGKYMMHCHSLVHEDHDMMGQFEVGDGGDDPLSAKARALPAPPLFTGEEQPARGGDSRSDSDSSSGSGERPRPRVENNARPLGRARLHLRSRLRLETVQRQGLPLSVDVPAEARVLDVRVMRGERQLHRRVIEARPGRRQSIRLRDSRLLHALRNGTHRVVVRPGLSRTELGTAVSKGFRVI